jgi:HTH-type transcriptional regulator / antitoxin HipB
MNTIARSAKQLAAALRRHRRQQKLTQTALGGLMHVRQATVSKLERGGPGTQLGVVMDALAALDLELVVRPRTKATLDEIEDLF